MAIAFPGALDWCSSKVSPVGLRHFAVPATSLTPAPDVPFRDPE
jgi:hypothetical protein